MANRTITIKLTGDDRELEATLKRSEASINRLAQAARSVTSPGGASSRGSLGSGDAAMRQAQADIKRFQQSSIQAERELTRQVEREAKAQSRIKISEAKRANDEQIRQLKRIESEEKRAESERGRLQSSTGSLQNTAIGSFVGNLGASAVAAVTSELVSGGKALFNYTASLEQARIGFTTLTGSAANADAHIKALQDFAKKTPFDFGGLVKASQLLQGVGIETQRVIPILSDVGNALSAAGKGNEEIQRTVLALSQIASKGKLAGQEINQLSENGISAVSILAQATGKTRAEIIKLSEDGRISTDLFLQSLHKVVEARGIGDAMEKQSHTFNGAISNIYDALFQFGEKAFRPFFGKVAHLADDFASEVSKQNADFASIGKAIGDVIAKAMGLAIAEGAGAIKESLISGFGKILKGDFSEFSTPVGFGANVADESLKAAGKVSPIAALQGRLGLNPNVSFGESINQASQHLSGGTTQYEDAQRKQAQEGARVAALYASERAINERNRKFNTISNLTNNRPLIGKDDTIIKQDQKSIQYLDHLTNTIKTINLAVKKVPSLIDQLLPGKEKKGKKNPFDELEAIGTQLGFIATSKYRPGGPNGATDHAGKGAVDFGVNTNAGKTIDDYTRLAIAALERGKQVIDERVIGAFKGIKGSKNLHIGNSDNKSLFLPQSFYSVPVEYLKQLDAKRGSRKGLDVDTSEITKTFNEKIARELADQSDKLTKGAQDKFVQRAIDVYKIVGVIPSDDLLNKIQDKLADEAKKVGAAQPTVEDVARQFAQNAQNKAGVLTTSQAAGTNIAPAHLSTLDDDYLAKLKEELQIEQNIQDLILKTNNYEETVVLKAQAAIHQQAIDLRNTEIEYDTISRQNSDAEFVAKRRQLSALQEIVSLTQEYAQLTDEAANSSNAELNIARQRNRFQADTNNLIRQRADLEADLNSGERNRDLQIQVALYQDLIDLRGRDTQAIIAQNRATLELADAGTLHVEQLRANVLSHLAQQKTLTETLGDSIISIYDKIGAKSDKFLDKSVGKIPIIGDLVKNFARKGLTDLTHGLLDRFLPGASGLIGAPKTGNPQVDAINESNKYLESIDKKLGSASGFAGIGGTPSIGGTSQGTGGGILGTFQNLISGIFKRGGNNSGGGGLNTGSLFGGNAGGGIFNFAGQNGGAGASNQSVIQQLLGRASSAGSQGLTTSQSALSGLGGGTESGNFLSRIFGQKSIFGEGGFNNPKNAKIAGGLAAIASLAGGFISSKFGGSAAGRRIGGVLSGAGTGAQIGALLGGPVGALIGGGIGAIVGFFQAGGQRKKDEQARTEYLRGAIGDLKQIDALITDVRALRVSPESALSQATQIGATARTNYLTNAATIKDNKTRRIALSAVSELDYNIGVKLSELRKAADFAGSAIDRKNRIIPEFASGGFMDAAFAKQFTQFKRRNGNLGGSFTGADTIPAMLAQGEMVLNPMQQRRIIEAARHDIFRDKGIPGYAAGGFITPTVSAPTVNAANGASPININITLEGDGLTDLKVKEISLDGLKTETGERVVAEVFNKANRNNKIK